MCIAGVRVWERLLNITTYEWQQIKWNPNDSEMKERTREYEKSEVSNELVSRGLEYVARQESRNIFYKSNMWILFIKSKNNNTAK